MAKNKKDIFNLLDSTMSPEAAQRADNKADQIIHLMNLADIRKKVGVKQTEIKSFSQPQVSHIENKEDMTKLQISTLIEYAKSIGIGIKVVGYTKDPQSEEFEILKA